MLKKFYNRNGFNNFVFSSRVDCILCKKNKTLTNIGKKLFVLSVAWNQIYRINWKNTIKPLMNLKFNANIHVYSQTKLYTDTDKAP